MNITLLLKGHGRQEGLSCPIPSTLTSSQQSRWDGTLTLIKYHNCPFPIYTCISTPFMPCVIPLVKLVGVRGYLTSRTRLYSLCHFYLNCYHIVKCTHIIHFLDIWNHNHHISDLIYIWHACQYAVTKTFPNIPSSFRCDIFKHKHSKPTWYSCNCLHKHNHLDITWQSHATNTMYWAG